MRISQNMCALALQQMIGGACSALGCTPGASAIEGVATFLTQRFMDNSQRLNDALLRANAQAWKTLEVALAGDSLWDRCKVMLSSGEDRAFRELVRPFLDGCSLAEISGKTQFRHDCLRELRAAAKADLLTGGSLDPEALARQAGAFARFGDPQSVLEAEGAALDQVAEDLRTAGHVNLAAFVAIRPQRGSSLLVIAARYFFRRSVEEDEKLFRGLSFAQLDSLRQAQDQAFAGLHQLFREQAHQLERMLADVQVTVTATHDTVLDIQAEQQRQSEQTRDIYTAVVEMQRRLDLMHTELRPRDSLSIRNDTERQLVKELVGRYRNLPEEKRQQLPALLHAIGKLEVAAGDFQAAQLDFAMVAGMVGDPRAQAEAHMNAFRAALERRDWTTALQEIREAARLDPARFSPFPMNKFQPQRILGAGGFGVAFLCRHKYMNAEVVVKTLTGDDLERDVDQVFGEAQLLRQIDHPSIIRLQDCGFASPTEDARPYLVMDFFDGMTLEDHAREKPLPVDDLFQVARQMVEGLQAAHARGILHRDVKPANLLVRQEGGRWQAKLIDFGLALRRSGVETLRATSATLVGSSIAGTLDYAAPEQMGKLPGTPVRPCSDIYGFARTCCYALFQTPQPLLRHWRSIPGGLAELLEACLEDNPAQRPQDFATVLSHLDRLTPGAAPRATVPASPPPAAPKVPLPTLSVGTPLQKSVSEMTLEERQQALDELAAQVSGCTRCSWLVRSRTQTVFGTGPLDPEICFIGEAPGADEDRLGTPFVGAAGQMLDSIMHSLGISREEVYICNLIKCRPPGNRTPQTNEVTNCREFLERQLELVRPRYLVALGGCASQNLLGTTEFIGRLRGRLHDYKGIPVLCTYHPAFLLPTRSPERKKDVISDLKLLLRRMGRLQS